jgi:hypothetical protein
MFIPDVIYAKRIAVGPSSCKAASFKTKIDTSSILFLKNYTLNNLGQYQNFSMKAHLSI